MVEDRDIHLQQVSDLRVHPVVQVCSCTNMNMQICMYIHTHIKTLVTRF